ncbi:MAG: enoyl-CoA hydratase [Solirubrobacterales bacterium]|nr:enoyl-CoA hydratase [Solirubrobacterales bacterium]
MSGLVAVARVGGVAHLELNRPEALNAWTPELGRELLARLREAAQDPAVRAILVTGAGRAFSAGADVKNPREYTPNGEPDLSTRLREIYNPIVTTIRGAPKPVVGAIQGAAAGLGCSLALSCDLLLAGESAYLLLAFVHLGVIPDAGSSWFLAERVGAVRAAQLMMLGERLPAARALEWGLVNDVVPDDALRDSALALATRLAEGPTVALANMKRALASAAQAGLAAHLELEATLQQAQAGTADYAEGVAAFKEKRRAAFRGT